MLEIPKTYLDTYNPTFSFLTKITSYLHKMLLFFPIQFSNSFKSFPDAKWMLIFDQVEGINNQKFKQISKELPSAPT